ncbi:MAG: hypothetical protein K2X57_18425 [Xanthobacteraceae bacterium]|nr:hypothetical protein [Xanthobacteraceae bacterium]
MNANENVIIDVMVDATAVIAPMIVDILGRMTAERSTFAFYQPYILMSVLLLSFAAYGASGCWANSVGSSQLHQMKRYWRPYDPVSLLGPLIVLWCHVKPCLHRASFVLRTPQRNRNELG